MRTISIVGLGYVGLPLSVSASKANFIVNGIDTDIKKIELIKSGVSPIGDVESTDLKELVDLGKLLVSSNFDGIAKSEIVVICVPTPLNDEREPDFSFIEKSAHSISKFLKAGTLVVLESTVQPGTTREVLIPLIVKYSGLASNQFDFAYSPERIDPSNKVWTLFNTPKVVSGFDKQATDRTIEFYSHFVDLIVEAPNIEVAELAKLLENSFRFINISFINEFTLLCEKLKIDVNKVIEVSSTKPYGFMPFFPSLGVGGHCIPVDPVYLSDISKKTGVASRFIDLAVEVNAEIPSRVVDKAKSMLGNLDGQRILVIGVAYKSNVSDTRETPAEALIAELQEQGAEVLWHDDLVRTWGNSKSEPLGTNYDLAIIATHHDYLDLKKLGDVPILNTRSSI